MTEAIEIINIRRAICDEPSQSAFFVLYVRMVYAYEVRNRFSSSGMVKELNISKQAARGCGSRVVLPPHEPVAYY